MNQQEEYSICQIMEQEDGVMMSRYKAGAPNNNQGQGQLGQQAGIWQSAKVPLSVRVGLSDSVFFPWIYSHHASLFCKPLTDHTVCDL